MGGAGGGEHVVPATYTLGVRHVAQITGHYSRANAAVFLGLKSTPRKIKCLYELR